MTQRQQLVAAGLAALALAAAPAGRAAAAFVVEAAGPNTASIQGAVDQFRAALGDPNNGNAPGPLDDGRREINWDGGGTATTPAGTPFAGFQVIRGALFETPGTGFVQAPPASPDPTSPGLEGVFGNPTYATAFAPFSAPRLFSPVGSNITDVTFTVPGDPGTAATVTGFGVVFSDVDLANTTSIEYFGFGGNSLGVFFAPAAPGTATFSFLGVIFDEAVARVRITTGNAAPGPNDGGGVDVVMMDDFLYSEPRAVPEPASLALIGVGVVGLIGYGRYGRGPRPPAVA